MWLQIEQYEGNRCLTITIWTTPDPPRRIRWKEPSPQVWNMVLDN